MGIAKSSSMALFGPYYYYSELDNALKYGGWDNYIKDNKTLYSNSHGKYKNGALLRYAIFKKEIVKLNTITDTLDNSLTTRQMIKENPKAKKLQRLSDRDGSWTKKYDSIYVGKHEKIEKNSSMIAIKDSNNCHLLSCSQIKYENFS